MLLVSPNFFSKLCSFLKIMLGLVKVCSLKKKKTTKQVQIIIIYHIYLLHLDLLCALALVLFPSKILN